MNRVEVGVRNVEMYAEAKWSIRFKYLRVRSRVSFGCVRSARR